MKPSNIFEVKIKPYRFFVKIDRVDNMNVLHLGSSKLPQCVSIIVFDNEPIADLHGVLYDKLCSSNIPLSKKDNGTVKMVNAIIAIARNQFPYVTKFKLTDMSKVDCNELRTRVWLADMYFYRYGKTWYEDRFGAYPDVLAERYKRLKTAFAQKPSLPFALIWSFMPSDMKGHDDIRTLYEHSDTWHTFFEGWFERDGCIPFMYIHKKNDTIMRNIFPEMKTLQGTDWIIDATSLFDPSHLKFKPATYVPKIKWITEEPPPPVLRLFGGEMYLGEDV